MADSIRARVMRIFIHAEGTSIRLEIPADSAPEAGYFNLALDHPSYQTLFALALSAAINRQPLLINTVEEISPTQPAKVQYMVVDW